MNSISLISLITGEKQNDDLKLFHPILIKELNQYCNFNQIITSMEEMGIVVDLSIDHKIENMLNGTGRYARWSLMLNTTDTGVVLYKIFGGVTNSDEHL